MSNASSRPRRRRFSIQSRPLSEILADDRYRKLQRRFFKLVDHYFGGLEALCYALTDPRDPRYTTYPLASLIFSGIWLFATQQGTRRQANRSFQREAMAVLNFKQHYECDSYPHGDSLNELAKGLSVEEVQSIIVSMLKTLISKRCLENNRLLGHYVIALDGTGTLNFGKVRHCSECLHLKQKGITYYYHYVLEAKLVAPNGMAFPLFTEFLDSAWSPSAKQDCELTAVHRIMEKIKKNFPLLPICLTLDGLFANGPVIARCQKYHWKYVIVHPNGKLKVLHQDFQFCQHWFPQSLQQSPEVGCYRQWSWQNELFYTDSSGQQFLINVLRSQEAKPNNGSIAQRSNFQWITNFQLNADNVVLIGQHGGRIRWNIENQGFNAQKRGGFELEHAYSEHPNAVKIFHLLLQIAHLLLQLFRLSSLCPKPDGLLPSIRQIARDLQDAWRFQFLSREDLRQLWAKRIRVSLDTT